VHRTQRKEAKLMADAGPPLTLIALGLILWLAVDATLAGISIQLIGVILFVVGVAWLVIEIVQSRAIAPRRRPAPGGARATARCTDLGDGAFWRRRVRRARRARARLAVTAPRAVSS
jgi:membrane-bound ClpP family serine protease